MSRRASRHWGEARFGVAPACVAAAVALFAPTVPEFFTLDNILSVAVQMWMLALLAVGQTFAIVTRGFDISVGSVAALSSTVAALAMVQIGPLGFVAAPVVGLICGAINGWLIGTAGLQPIVATLAMLIGARGVSLLASGNGQAVPLPEAASVTRLAFESALGLPPVCWGAVILVVAAAWWLRRTADGRRLVMLGSNPQAAQLVGVPVRRSYLLAYGLCGGFAGMAGLLLTIRAGAGLPTEGDGMALQAIAASVIGGTALGGGVASIAGVVTGAAFIQLLMTGLNLQGISPFVAQAMVGAVIIGSALVEYTIRKFSKHNDLQGTSS